MNISVVIPTLGLSDNLILTIESLNNNSIKPFEILLCIPSVFKHNLNKLIFPNNVVIIETIPKGQVQQRIEGFRNVKSDYVLQIDDDCIVDKNLIEILYNKLTSQKTPTAIAPELRDIYSKKSLYNRKNNLLEFVFRLLINGNKNIIPGSVTKAGINYGVDFVKYHSQKVTLEVDWLPGGCFMLNSKDLIFDNYFPFNGKAYCEDLIHSFLLKKNGVKLFVTNETYCETHIDSNLSKSLILKLKNFWNELRIRYYYVKLCDFSRFHLIIYSIISVFKITFRHLFNFQNEE